MPFVLDASAALAWCFADEASLFSLALLRRLMESEEAIVPAHWAAEMLSALMQGKRRGRIDDLGIERFISNLASFRISIEQSPAIAELPRWKALSDKHNLSAYDAEYLRLAKRTGLPLATLDIALVKACRAEAVAVLTEAAS